MRPVRLAVLACLAFGSIEGAYAQDGREVVPDLKTLLRTPALREQPPERRYSSPPPSARYDAPSPRYTPPPRVYVEPAPQRARLGDSCLIEGRSNDRTCDLRRPQPLGAYCECVSPSGRVREGRVTR